MCSYVIMISYIWSFHNTYWQRRETLIDRRECQENSSAFLAHNFSYMVGVLMQLYATWILFLSSKFPPHCGNGDPGTLPSSCCLPLLRIAGPVSRRRLPSSGQTPWSPVLESKRWRSRWLRRPGSQFNRKMLARVLAWKTTWVLARDSPHSENVQKWVF